MTDVTLYVLFFGPVLFVTLVGVRDLRRWWRLEVDQYHKWWRWISFTEPLRGQQNHLPQGQNHKALGYVFRLDEKNVCRFRLPFGVSPLGTIGQVTWDSHEIHVEGRMSRLTLISPVIIALGLGGVVGGIYLRETPDPKLWSLFALIGGTVVGICIVIGLTYLIQIVFERASFRRAYLEIRSCIWQQA